jgi:type I restriction enzyme, S subunit
MKLKKNRWQSAPFGDVAAIPNGQVDPKSAPYDAMLVVGPEQMRSGGGLASGQLQTARALGMISGKYEFSEHHVLFSKIRPNLNKVCFPRFRGLCSADVYPVQFDDAVCLPGFGYQVLLSDLWLKPTIAASMRTGLPKVNRADIETIEIPLPPLDEQRRIADALVAWDRAIESAEALAAAKLSRASALAAPLVWNDDDPWVSLEEVLTQSSTRVGPDLNPPIFSVSKEGLSPQEDRFNKRIANEDLSRHMLVLPGQLALSGLNFWLGSVAISEEPGPICISPDYKVFTLSGLAHACFFKHVVRSKPFRDLLISCSMERASVVRRNFNRELFFASEIPLPAPKIQMKRAALLEGLHQEVRREEQRLEGLRNQKRGLVQKLLTGEWRLPVGASEQAA